MEIKWYFDFRHHKFVAAWIPILTLDGVDAVAVLRVGGDALDPGLHLGRDLGEHIGVAVEAVHADGRVSTNILMMSTAKCCAWISDVCKPVVLQIVERTAGVSPASAEVRLVSARGADMELTVIRH